MSWRRNLQNMDAKRRAKEEMWAAWDAIENFRRDGNCSGFPDLRRYLDDFTHRPSPWASIFKISGWGILDEQVTREEYDSMKSAWKQTEEGKGSSHTYDWETPEPAVTENPSE